MVPVDVLSSSSSGARTVGLGDSEVRCGFWARAVSMAFE